MQFWQKYRRHNGPAFALPRVKDAAEDAPEQSVGETFKQLRDAWKASTRFISSISKTVSDPNYLKIIGLGPAVLPSIIEELRREPDLWFVALEAITRENPVQPEHAGDVAAMAEDWLQWEVRRHSALVCA